MPDLLPSSALPSPVPLPVGAGMRALIDGHDWAATALGPIAAWPSSLRTIVTLMLDSTEAMVVWWGPQCLQIYNDAYAPRLGQGAPGAALGQPAPAYWKHSWALIGPQAELVLAGQPARAYRDLQVSVERKGRVEDTYWTYSFTPVRDDAGAVGGVLLLSRETTERVLGARRQQTLDLLRHGLAKVSDVAALEAAVQAAVQFNPGDLPAATVVAFRAGSDAPSTPQHVRIAAREVGIDVDLAVVFALSPTLAPDDAYHLFLEQFTLLVANARHRIDSEALRLVVEAERDRLLLDAPVGAAVMIGEELRYHLVNAIYARVSGRPFAEMVGKSFLEVFPELDGSPVHLKFTEVYRAGEPFVSQPTLVQIHRHGGTLDDRYFTYNLSPLRTLDGEVYGLMVIAVDITEQVEARAEVEQLNTELQAAARAKDEFLALLGHELRNPLAPIVTALELMRMRDRTTDREQVVIRRQVSHLTRLVDDLLDVSRITRGKVELRKEEVEVRDVLLRAVEMVTPMIEQRRQHLDVQVAPAGWYGDPARLAQVVSNLLTNASRYSDAGARIALRTAVSDGMLEIEVVDNGVGLPAELLPRIFEPFVQGERKLHGSVGGLGIGLALVKNLVELHGGSVTARSEGVGKGSAFSVQLPLMAGPSPAAQRAPGPNAPVLRDSRRVLVVDDNVDAADTLAEMLRMYGHQVAVAYSPEAALQAFMEERIDLAILDIGLPGKNGYELADMMRASGCNAGVRFVALSGFGQALDKERSAAAGFEAHLVKPLTPEALGALV